MKHNALLLAVLSIAVAVLGFAATLALVITRIVIPQFLWIASPYLALGIIGYCCRKNALTAGITLAGTILLVVGGFYTFKVGDRVWAVAYVPAYLWLGCAVLVATLFVFWLLRRKDR